MSSSTKTQWILELVDRVTKPLKDIKRYSSASQRSLGGVDRLLERINTKSSLLTSKLKKMGIAAVAFGALTVGSIQFEQGMARANTMANVGSKELALYSDQIRNIAEIVPKTKKELAEGLYQTISAGVPKENWITFLRDSSKAALGGAADVGLVVESTSSIIKAYGDEWSNAAKIQDKFQKTVQLGQIPSLQALASALPRVSAVAADLKVEQSELLSVFATASGVMGKPAEVATQLNSVLSAMSKPGAEAIKTANNLGIAFNANSIQKAGGLKNYIDLLMPRIKAFSDQTGQTQQDIIGKLFGSQEAIKLVIGLGGNLSESWGQNTAKINNSTGAVQSAFNIMQSTTQGNLSLLKNSFSNTMDGIFTALAPAINFIVKGTSKVFGFINSFIQANPMISKFIIVTGGLAFGLTFLGTALALVSLRVNALYLKFVAAALSSNAYTAAIGKAGVATMGFFGSLWKVTMQLAGQAVGYALVGASMLGSFVVGIISATAAQLGLNVAMSANPIGLIVIGIAAAVGAMAVMIKYWGTIKKVIWDFTKWIWKVSPFGVFSELAEIIFPGFKAKVAAIFDYVKNLVLGFWNKIKAVFGSIKKFFGFGDDETAEVDVNLNKPENGSPVPVGLGLDTQGLLVKPTGGENKGKLNGISGGGSGKSLTMNLEIKNYFNLSPGNWEGKIDKVAEMVVGKINDRMRDAAIALE